MPVGAALLSILLLLLCGCDKHGDDAGAVGVFDEYRSRREAPCVPTAYPRHSAPRPAVAPAAQYCRAPNVG
jgi:hypothetical protein